MDKEVAIVTGGGTGIGAATCRRLAADGLAVVVAYSRSSSGADSVVREISAAGGEAWAHRVNISVEEDVVALFEAVLARHKRVDVVVNNAGIGHMKPIHDISMEEYDYIFSTNARGTFMMCREAARVLREGGRIVNVSTGMTRASMAGQALYTASKIAIEGYSRVLARELGPRQISVNIVSPGMTDTPMLEGGDADMLRNIGSQMAAMQRCGQPEDVADAIGALVSGDCRWVTGENLSVSGGSNIG